MATSYDGESAANKTLIDNWSSNLRAQLGEFARVMVRTEALRSQYNQEISALIGAWDNTEEVPNNGGLAGASTTETHEQMITWQSYLDTFSTNLGTSGHKDQYTSAAGPGNVVG